MWNYIPTSLLQEKCFLFSRISNRKQILVTETTCIEKNIFSSHFLLAFENFVLMFFRMSAYNYKVVHSEIIEIGFTSKAPDDGKSLIRTILSSLCMISPTFSWGCQPFMNIFYVDLNERTFWTFSRLLYGYFLNWFKRKWEELVQVASMASEHAAILCDSGVRQTLQPLRLEAWKHHRDDKN
jgi:hypothetical protein